MHAQERQSRLVERGRAEANQWGPGRVPARGDPAQEQDAELQGPTLHLEVQWRRCVRGEATHGVRMEYSRCFAQFRGYNTVDISPLQIRASFSTPVVHKVKNARTGCWGY